MTSLFKAMGIILLERSPLQGSSPCCRDFLPISLKSIGWVGPHCWLLLLSTDQTGNTISSWTGLSSLIGTVGPPSDHEKKLQAESTQKYLDRGVHVGCTYPSFFSISLHLFIIQFGLLNSLVMLLPF